MVDVRPPILMHSPVREAFRDHLAGRYELLDEIGRGAMGAVYRTRDVRHERDVAVKVLDPAAGVAIGAERFTREIGIVAQLRHPNVLPLLDSGQAGPYLFYVMTLADGGSLRDRLARDGPLPIADAMAIVRDVAGALGHAHEQDVVHRDVKPGNVLFLSGHAMIADFGLARAAAASDATPLTRSGVSVGTPWYMSPEQIAGDREIDRRADLYSLACVFFEMIAGDPPFTGSTVRVVLARHLSERPPSLAAARPDAPDAMSAAVTRALSKVPGDRPRTVHEFLQELEGTAGARGRVARQVARAAMVLALAVVGAAAWVAFRPEPPTLSPTRVAIAPLETRGLGSSNPLDGAGLAYLIEAALEHAEPLRLVDATGLLDRRTPEAGPPSVQEIREAAIELGAAHFLTGVVQGYGDSTVVLLRLHDTAADSVVDQSSVSGAFGTPLHHLGIDSLLGLLPSLIDPGIEVDLTPLRERRADAVALWWQAERAYRRAHFREALGLYQRALRVDSSLVIAAVKGAQAAEWLHDRDGAQRLLDLALQQPEDLPSRYRVLARGLSAYFAAEPDTAVAWLTRATTIAPDWWEAWAALGEVYHHQLPSEPYPDSAAELAFRRGLAQDSASSAAFHLAEILIRRGELEAADRLVHRLRTAEADPDMLVHLTTMAGCARSPAATDWNRLATTGATSVLLAGKALSAAGARLDCAEGAFRAVLGSEAATPGDRWGAFLGLQATLIATGRDREAERLIDSVGARTGQARSLHVIGAAAGAALERGAEALDSFARARYGAGYEGVGSAEALWTLAVWKRVREDHAGLALLRARLADRASGAQPAGADAFFGRAIDAQAVAAVDPAEAVSMLPTGSPNSDLAWGLGPSLAPERLAVARALLRARRWEEARSAASVFDHPAPIHFVSFVPASLAIRLEAARAVSNHDLVDRYRARLESLHRLDLLTPPP